MDYCVLEVSVGNRSEVSIGSLLFLRSWESQLRTSVECPYQHFICRMNQLWGTEMEPFKRLFHLDLSSRARIPDFLDHPACSEFDHK